MDRNGLGNCDKYGPRTNQRRKNLIRFMSLNLLWNLNQTRATSVHSALLVLMIDSARILSISTDNKCEPSHQAMAKPVSKWESDLKWFKLYVGKRHPNLV